MKVQILIISILFSSVTFAEKTLQQCIDTESDLERLQCYDEIFSRSKEKQIPISSKQSSVNTNKEDLFGKEQIKNSSEKLNSISAIAMGSFKNWKKGQIITLDNGQKWKLKNSRELNHKIKNPRVTISKGLLSSYKMSIEGVNTIIKVTRVK